MKRLPLLLLLLAAPADADTYIDVAHYYYAPDGVTWQPPTEDEVALAIELRLDLQQTETEARTQCEVLWADAGADTDKQTRIRTWMTETFTKVRDSRMQLIGTVEALFPTTEATTTAANALALLRDLHIDQMDTNAQLEVVYEDPYAVDPVAILPASACEARQVSDNLRYDHTYYAQSAERMLVEQFPDDDRRDDALSDLAELYADLDWRDALSWTLREILCPGQNDAAIDYGAYGGIYGGPTVDYKTCQPTSRLDGEELVSAWLALADQEHTIPGRRLAEIAARERAASVPGVAPQLGVLWELATAYLQAGERVEAIPVLDELAQIAYSDSTQLELADQAVAKTGETLAMLWRESSLPTPDAALKLAQIYFHQGRRKHPHVRGVFAALARSLRELGAYEQAASVQRELVDAWPLHPMAPVAASELIEIELERGDRDAADDARVSLVEQFGDGSAWASTNGAAAAAVLVDDTRMALARSRYQTAIQVAEATPAGAAAALADARRYLEAVIAASGSPAHVLEGRFLLGEILVRQGDGEGAAGHFGLVVGALPKDTPLREAAIGRMVRAREDAVQQAIAAGTLVLPPVPTDFAATTLAVADVPEPVTFLHQAYALLLTVLERDDDLAEGLWSDAELSLRYGDLAAAETSLRSIVTDHCFTGSARKARDVLVQLVEARDGAAAAEEITKDVTARGCLDSAKSIAARDKDLEKQLTKARTLIGKGEFLSAARLLDREYLLTPSTSALADDVLLEAAQAWISAGDDAAAADLLDELDLRAELATSPKLLELQTTRAQLAERRLDWPAAARGYLAAAATAAAAHKKGDSKEISALFKAAEMLAADHAWVDRGNDPGAITLFLKVARRSVVGVANAAWMRAAQLARRAGRRDLLAAIHTEWRKGKLDRDHGLVLERMEGQAAEAAGDRKGAETHYREVVTKGWTADNLGDDAKDAVVAAKFWLAEDALRTDTVFKAFKWGKDQEDDRKRLQAIGDRIEELGKPFRACADLSPRWRLAVSVRTADITIAAIEAFVTAPPPEWLLQMMKDQGGDVQSMTHAEGMRMLLENDYRSIAYTMSSALAEPRVAGDEQWARLAEQRLAEIGSFVADVTTGARTEVLVEEVKP